MSPQTGYAPVNGLRMYCEVHGSGGTPLLLLHGGLFNIDLQFRELIPGLALDLRAPVPARTLTAVGQSAAMRAVERLDVLGGLIHEYRRAA